MRLSSLLLQLASGMAVTVEIFVLTLLFSLPLGLGAAFLRMSKNRAVQAATKVYISIMRGTPLMLQLYAVFYLPFYVFHLSVSPGWRFTACILAFSVNYAAYFAEIYRGGILSTDKGQYEAAYALGFSKRSAFWHIILPQVLRTVLPSITNEVITLVKDTSLAFAISILEMFAIAKQIAASERGIGALIAAGVFYYVFNFLVAWAMERLERRLAYY